jgi:hypothetical protein
MEPLGVEPVIAGAHGGVAALVAEGLERRPARAVANNRDSAAGSSVAVDAISAAWASEISPRLKAAAVEGRSSSWRAASRERAAEPTLTPVVDASQRAAEPCSSRFHTTASCTRRATSPRPATANRSQRVKRSTSFLAPETSSVPGSSSSATSSKSATAPRIFSNTLATVTSPGHSNQSKGTGHSGKFDQHIEHLFGVNPQFGGDLDEYRIISSCPSRSARSMKSSGRGP